MSFIGKIGSTAGKVIISITLILFLILTMVGMVLVWFSDWDIGLKIFTFIVCLILGPGFTAITLLSAYFRNKR